MDILERLYDTELSTSSDVYHLRKDAIAEIERLRERLGWGESQTGEELARVEAENERLRIALDEACARLMASEYSSDCDFADRLRRDVETKRPK